MGSTVVFSDFLDEHDEGIIVGLDNVLHGSWLIEIVAPELVEQVLLYDLSLLNRGSITSKELSMLCISFLSKRPLRSIFFLESLKRISSSFSWRVFSIYCSNFYLMVVLRWFIGSVILI